MSPPRQLIGSFEGSSLNATGEVRPKASLLVIDGSTSATMALTERSSVEMEGQLRKRFRDLVTLGTKSSPQHQQPKADSKPIAYGPA
jgi:hypothetical protein